MLFYYLPIFVWILFIYYLSNGISLKDAILHPKYYKEAVIALKHGQILNHTNTWIDELANNSAHVFVYIVLGFFVIRAFAKDEKLGFSSKAIVVWSVFLASAYGILDEFHQYFVPLRSFSVEDMIADFLGALIGVYIFLYIQSKERERTLHF